MPGRTTNIIKKIIADGNSNAAQGLATDAEK